ncbi:MAG: leucine-rich repeat protein [Clostridia bacterium]|nr:leucine-rich repeat protein [Clostridia bacterium]
MKKKLFFVLCIAVCAMLFAITASATSVVPQKPTLDVDFGAVTTIPEFTPPSELYKTTTERVLLVDGEGNYVTYPTYYVTKDSTTFDFDFSKLNSAQSVQYSKKSVVMLEIPKGVTTISNSYFSGTGNFPLCVSVQFPGTVTSYGASLFAGHNSVIRVVEFLDGTEPITMGNNLFGAQWNGGADNIEYVKFPNNLVSIGSGTFGKAYQSKTIILGENLETIGENFFSESTPSDKDTFLYVSDNFFKDTSKLFANLFGSNINGKNTTELRLTIFYTGTQAQAQALVDAYTKVQTGYVLSNSTLVSASAYDYATHKPNGKLKATIIYDCNKCDAFYNGIHAFDTDCTTADSCENGCGLTNTKNDSHNNSEKLTFANGITAEGVYTLGCTNDGCGANSKTTVAPVFTAKGYSTNTDKNAINGGYSVDLDSLALYERLIGELKYGIIIANANSFGEKAFLDQDNKVNSDKALQVEMDKQYTSFDCSINFGTKTDIDLDLVICAYVIEGDTVTYIQSSTGDDVTIGDTTFKSVTLAQVVALAPAESKEN